jgi:hypothetical protein
MRSARREHRLHGDHMYNTHAQCISPTSLIVPVAASTSTTSGRQCTVAAQSRHTAAQVRLRVARIDTVSHNITALKLGPCRVMNRTARPSRCYMFVAPGSTWDMQVSQSVVHHHLSSSGRY